jgi:hypothetical protein
MKIWEFFDELLNLRNHLGTKVLINFGRSTHGGWYCNNISYLVGEDIESGDQFELLRVYDQLKKSKVLPGQILTMGWRSYQVMKF